MPGTGTPPVRCLRTGWEGIMGKDLLLWLVGIPIPVIIVLWLLFFR